MFKECCRACRMSSSQRYRDLTLMSDEHGLHGSVAFTCPHCKTVNVYPLHAPMAFYEAMGLRVTRVEGYGRLDHQV